MKPSVLPPELSKTVYFTPGRFSTAVTTVTAGCYSNGEFATVPAVLQFLFIFGEFLENHNKS